MAIITTTRTINPVSPRRGLRRRSTLGGSRTWLTAVVAVLLLALALGAAAQPTGKTARVGYLTPVTGRNQVEEAFEQALQELGWSRGQNLTIESRYAGGRQDTIAPLVAEIVGRNPDVIVANGPGFGLAVKQATGQIPVVFLSMLAAPVDLGLVSNVAHPGGNLTGIGIYELGLDAKRLELLKEAVPALRRIALLLSSEQTLTSKRRQHLTAAAQALQLDVDETQVTTPAELEAAIRQAKTRDAQALYVVPSGFMFSFSHDIAALALAQQLPSIQAFREGVLAGGLLAYGPSPQNVLRRGAVYVDKILRGAKPGDLPVEQPTKFDLFINLKTAKALGLTMPPSLLVQAEQVIECGTAAQPRPGADAPERAAQAWRVCRACCHARG
jgi:putative ABC transport system substrate-binding protein